METAIAPTDSIRHWDPWGDDGIPPNLVARLVATGVFSEPALEAIGALARELEQRLSASAPGVAVTDFVHEAEDDARDRRAVVRIMEKLSALCHGPLGPPPWTEELRRILTEIEFGLVRLCALRSSQRTGVVALFESGAASGELGKVGTDDVGENAGRRVVAVPGTERDVRSGYPVARPRTLLVPTWAHAGMDRLRRAPATSRLLYAGGSTDKGKIQSSLLMIARHVLNEAGLGEDSSVKPLSIRNTGARRVYETSGIEAAAEVLGHDDLMFVAREIAVRARR